MSEQMELRLRQILRDLYAAIESHPLNLHFLHYTSLLREKRLFSQKFFVTLHITDRYSHDSEDIRGMAIERM